ncbi:MAG: hypothetical protein JWQ01_4730 [Massilia sp.]|nr:hypothetical protein [Massilia sp.]
MNWLRLTRTAASRRFDELSGDGAFTPGDLPLPYQGLRRELEILIPKFHDWPGSKISYDLEVGFALRRALENEGFDLRAAADDGFWRHLSLIVVPHIVLARWDDKPEDRFWRSRSRVWLRAMWWFVHLTWQGSERSTRAAVDGLTTDDVVQLVERPGRGFRVDLCRALVRAAGEREPALRKFRQLMKLNTAKLVMIEPAFQQGGVEGYVRGLYTRLEQ